MAHEQTLPSDPFERQLAQLVGLPNGAHTAPALIQSQDFYGNVSAHMVQSVRWDEGVSVFITQVVGGVATRLVLPPKVVEAIKRQGDALTAKLRRRHGQRLAEQRRAAGVQPTFTPEMRLKAAATRRRKAAERRARKGA